MSKKLKSKKLDKDTKIILMITISVFLLIFMFLFIKQSRDKDNFNNIKEDKSNYLVYTKTERKGKVYSTYIPYLNLNYDIAKSINEDIDLFTSEFTSSKKAMISYDYDVNGIILSLVIKIVDYDTKYAPQPYFRTYNVNLDTGELISDESLLDYFGVSEDDVENKLEKQFHYYYKEIVKEKYFYEDECDYSCFLKYKEIDNTNYSDRVVYYIDDGNLVAYKPFVFYSIFGEENYFKDKHFKFLIVKKES